MKKKTIKQILIFLVEYIFLILILTFIGLVLMQKNFFFHPWHDEASYKILSKNKNFEKIKIDNNGKKLSGWMLYNTEEEVAPLVIFFAGNAENSSNVCLNFFNNGIFNYFEGYNFMIIDYPEYGLSEGKITEETLFKAGLNIYDYASSLECVDKEKIVILGYSIGTGISTYVASQRNVNGLILIAPYDSALSLYNNAINVFYGPMKIFTKYKLNSLEYAKNVDVAPLIFTSYTDKVIDYRFSVNLEKHFKEKGNIKILDNTTHVEYFSRRIVLDGIYEYLQERK